MLLLVSFAALSFFSYIGPQDVSRLALSHALAFERSVRIDRWESETIDKASRAGHFYTDKAPGMSLAAAAPLALLHAAGLVDQATRAQGVWTKRSLVWIIRVLTGGAAFVALVFIVGRAAESVLPGTGAATAAALGLGTLVLPLAATVFGHVSAAALAFAAFVFAACARRETHQRTWAVAAGVCGGLAILFEYQVALAVLVVLGYLVVTARRLVPPFVGGLLPGVLALAAYNVAAFGSPVRMSYRFVAEERFAEHQREAFFGIGLPDVGSLWRVLFTSDGLVTQSPVLVLAAVGLVLLWRSGYRAEAAVCTIIPVVFLFVTAGYYDPFGGLSPGPRFFVPALPFLALGLAPVFARWRTVAVVATFASMALVLHEAGTWAVPDELSFTTVGSLLGAPKGLSVALICAAAAIAVIVANVPPATGTRADDGETARL